MTEAQKERTLVERTRPEFEEWIRDSGQFTDWSRAPDWSELKGIYLKPRVQLCWEAWYASQLAAERRLAEVRAEEREACAKIVDAEFERILSKQTPSDDLSIGASVNANLRMMACVLPDIASAIRSQGDSDVG